jgi:DNA-binding CsgD family transcriptional regulator
LKAAAAGETNAQIAARLWISHHTVRKHLEHVFDKLGVHTRTEAAALLGSAHSQGIDRAAKTS